jgi:Fic family protein
MAKENIPKFEPNFHYTDKIVGNLTKIASAQATILNSFLVPKWEITLRREALLKSAHASTSIEGNPLSLEDVSNLAEGREVTATRKSKQEVLNYLQVLTNISSYAPDGKITEEAVLRLHKNVAKATLDYPEDEGKYRDRQVFVGDRFGNVVFMPPKTSEVPGLMRAFVEWLNSNAASSINPVLAAGIAHYEFVRIHPFIDGNGRTSRALATLILYTRGFDIKRFFALDDYYDGDRPAYYAALQSIDKEKRDLTGWLEYFTDGVKQSIKAVEERILRLSSEKLRKDVKGQIALTERQMKIIEYINQKGKIAAGNISEMFGLSRQGALKEMSKLVKLGVVKLEGAKRGAHYVMA